MVLWSDLGGYDAYRTEKRFVPWERAQWRPPPPQDSGEPGSDGPSTPNRSGVRFAPRPGMARDQMPPGAPITRGDFERVRGGQWDLPTLQKCVDQFVLHYDVCGVSRECFRILHDVRGLSVHFLLDIDGTIYQTMDLKEKAWHATISNDRSIGIEIANIGAYSADDPTTPLDRWYEPDPGPFRTREERQRWLASPPVPPIITIPDRLGDGGVRVPGRYSAGYQGLVHGQINGREVRMYDFTPEQYAALTKLTAALCEIFPLIKPDYPRDASGTLITTKLSDDQLATFRGVLGHYHIQTNKVDPGPAMNWARVTRAPRPKNGS